MDYKQIADATRADFIYNVARRLGAQVPDATELEYTAYAGEWREVVRLLAATYGRRLWDAALREFGVMLTFRDPSIVYGAVNPMILEINRVLFSGEWT